MYPMASMIRALRRRASRAGTPTAQTVASTRRPRGRGHALAGARSTRALSDQRHAYVAAQAVINQSILEAAERNPELLSQLGAARPPYTVTRRWPV